MPTLLDDVPLSLAYLLRRGGAEKIAINLAPEWQPIDPFAGLPTDR